jgi:hypothetical protein
MAIRTNVDRVRVNQRYNTAMMDNVRLSPETTRHVDLLFLPADRADAARLLVEECGNNLPFLKDYDEFKLERFRFAALKLSDGDLEKLRSAVALAKVDWRDLLVAAGFANDIEAHNRWLPGQETR